MVWTHAKWASSAAISQFIARAFARNYIVAKHIFLFTSTAGSHDRHWSHREMWQPPKPPQANIHTRDVHTRFNQSGVSCGVDSGFIMEQIKNNTDKLCKQSLCKAVGPVFIGSGFHSQQRTTLISCQVTAEISKLSRFSWPCDADSLSPSLKHMHNHSEQSKHFNFKAHCVCESFIKPGPHKTHLTMMDGRTTSSSCLDEN